ncbi:COG1361 S-layer family protein [uncultured Methanomethylovorans sp.]|uniref:COG1361 S-layer family protein n=1 Tax=uncultured Methanomethylovorans sp. TaxID=183759 RepID=UPI002AA621B0|nr:COG1361 S-layer family protein [uncultured Methanomethylovorans sp.]
MKRLLIFILLILSPIAHAAAASDYVDATGISVDVISQTPNPARPGETVELTLSVQNFGNEDLKNIVMTAQPEYPFSQVDGESLTKTISYLNARQDASDAATVKLKLKVDADVPEGTYELDVVTTDSSGATKTTTLDIEVRGKEYAQVVTISKSSIDFATEEQLDFVVTNTGSSPLKNMQISWEDPTGTILPVYSDNTKYIRYLAANQSVTVSYIVMADVNADPGLYQLDINLEVEDYNSNVSTISTTAGLFVGGGTDFDVAFSDNSDGEMSFSIANIGNNEAYSVKVSIPEQDGYTVSGSSSTIVGNLEKGDYTIASFTVSQQAAGGIPGAPSGAPGGTASASSTNSTASDDLNVLIEYTDAAGQRNTVEKSVPISQSTSLTTATAGSGGAPGQSSSSSTYTYIALVAVVLASGYVVYHRRKYGENPAVVQKLGTKLGSLSHHGKKKEGN